MLKPIFISADSLDGAPYRFRYLVAGFELFSQTEIALIESFRLDLIEEVAPAFDTDSDAPDISSAVEVYNGMGAFSGGEKHVVASYEGAVQQLSVQGQKFSLADLANQHIRLLSANTADVAEVAEILLGPPLLCVMAWHKVFSFHAGAVNTVNGAALFIGESGRGKSTLSTECEELDWQRIGDDIMPLIFDQGEVVLQPRFPQLKRQKQYVEKGIIPLKALFQIAPPHKEKGVQFKRVAGGKAILTLSRHIASSKVFSPELLTEKMKMVAALANSVPVFELSYRRDINELTALKASIINQLA